MQQQAIEELQNLPKNHPFRETILELIGNLIAMLEQSKKEAGKLEPEEEEFILLPVSELTPLLLLLSREELLARFSND